MKAWIERGLVLAGLLSLWACGGSGGGSVTSPPPPPPPPPPPTAPTIDVQAAFPNVNFSQPVALVQAPADATRWYVVEQRGIVRAFDNDAAISQSDIFLDIQGRVNDNFSESGLLGIAFHPSYPGTPEVFLSYTADDGAGSLISTISRFFLNAMGDALDPASEQILLRIPQPFNNHNGGDLAFGQDGYLYASFGDGGSGGDPQGNGQDTSNLLGTIVRINVNGNSPYEIPPDNPFAGGGLCVQGFGGGGACPEIYAYGLRNPWRMSFDSAIGDLWLGDVGQGDWEEIDRVRLGGNYGWNEREGAHCYPPGSACQNNFDEPVTEYGRALGQSVTGGYVYRGTAIPDLVGWYVFGDFGSGNVFAVPADSMPTVAPEVLKASGASISTFAEGLDGELYIVSYAGSILQIVAAP